MLSERERRTLDDIERELATSDPQLAQLLAEPMVRPVRVTVPHILIIAGLLMIVLGAAASSLVTASFGMMITVTGVGTSLIRSAWHDDPRAV